MSLKTRVNRIFIVGTLASIGVAIISYFVFESFVQRENIASQKEKILNLLSSAMPLFTEEVIAERVYAISLKSQDFLRGHASEGLEFGIYKPDGSPFFETGNSITLKSLLHNGSDQRYIFEKRDVHFAGEVVGQVIFALKKDVSGTVAFRRYLLVTFGVLLFSFVFLFLLMQFYMNRWIVKPASKIAGSIPSIEPYLMGQLDQPQIPTDFGIFELDQIGTALKNSVLNYREASQAKMKMEFAIAQQVSLVQISHQVIHDLSGPLHSINVARDYLIKMKTDDPYFADHMKLLELGANRLNLVASNLLDQNKSAASQKESFLLQDVVQALVNEYRLQSPHVAFVIGETQDFASLRVYGSQIALQRAFANIIKNAVEAMEGKGEIEVAAEQRDADVHISISDNGPGMSEATLQKILHGGHSEGKSNGHGIGMKVVRETVEDFGGTLSATSVLGGGTKFSITLPLATI